MWFHITHRNRAHGTFFRTSLRTILVNGVLCTIQVRGTYKFRPNGREYACLEVGRDIMKGKIALFGFRRGRRMKLYVIPTLHLRNISFVYIPADGEVRHRWQHKTQERLEPVRERMAFAGLTNDRGIIDSIPHFLSVETCRIATWYET